MNVEITEAMDLLDSEGRIPKEGWARRPHWRYDRSRIRAPWWRIKEWDYYSVLSRDGGFGITLTLSDLGYAGLCAVCFVDFERRYTCQVDTLAVLPRGRMGLGPDGDAGHAAFADARLALDFEYRPGERILTFAAPGIRDAEGREGLTGSVTLAQPPDLESMNIATSWAENRRAFYYNRKINCMPARGWFSVGDRRCEFDPARDFGALDWGRGRWTYRNRWYWSSASGYAGGRTFGWNLGYGFSDRTPASENALVVDGRLHKLTEVEFRIDTSDYGKPWRFTSSDGRFEMDFAPAMDRFSETNMGIIRSVQHQVFGRFTGSAVLDGGETIRVERFPGFAEDVVNQW